MDMKEFMSQYFKVLTKKFKEIVPPDQMKKSLLAATGAMIHNSRPGKTNQEVFMETFVPLVNRPAAELTPLFDYFYTHEYKELRSYTTPDPVAGKVVGKLAGHGYRLVLATNPVFPYKAIMERMRWAGVDSFPWELVTAYEDSHYCKPNPCYYDEILRKIGLPGHRVLMVGNDTTMDLIASSLGIKTFLVTDYLIDKGDSTWQPDFKGRLHELLNYLNID
ncbi:Phosphoglycolate phosphatase [Pelotomaculum propionicicum]|uniref:Phosphoglycolate phosphatase n=2 Tax=Pelotomaculum propionicicum TaxID=258475 RepID=A0A4Y7RKA9_9FIRM|nr:HAD family hydrolase [Peptococcaceae bacterium]TEB09424.1 Phosphoglycolate phosphatase [Pelotomaculum propionicicum]